MQANHPESDKHAYIMNVFKVVFVSLSFEGQRHFQLLGHLVLIYWTRDKKKRTNQFVQESCASGCSMDKSNCLQNGLIFTIFLSVISVGQ